MVDFLEREAKEGAPFRHIHGAGRDYAWMQEELLRRGVKLEDTGIEVREYIYDMPLVMAAADVVLCRAGASTISELTAIAKPSILVPSPNVTANHQEKTPGCWPTRGPRCCCWSGTVWRTPSMTQRTICCGTAAAGMTWSGH